MPFIIPFIPALAGIAAAGGAAAIALTVALTLVEMAAMMLLSKLLAPSAQGSQLSNGTTQEYTGTVEPRRIVYGTNLISGMNAIPAWCHGVNNEMLDQVLVVAGHEVSAIRDCYANQEFIPSASIGPITASLNDGLVSSGKFANYLWIRRHTGSLNDLVDTILLQAWPNNWDAAHRGLGVAKIYIQYKFDATVYSGGKCEIRAIVDGKILYDPRLDTAPGVNPTNPSYMRFSANPALCIVDYILDPVLGMGESSARIDWVAAVAAANLCDENVAIPGSLVQKRYNCNAILDCTAGYEDNLRTLAASFQGAVLYSSGKWVLLPGHWQTPTFAIGDDDIAGAFEYQTAIPYASRYNAVRGQFYDTTNLYQPTEYPPIRVAPDEIADGEGPVWRELQQPNCTNVFEAQRNAIILQRKSRRAKTWSFPATYAMYSIRPGDFGTLTISELNIVGQYVRCIGWKIDAKPMTIVINLEEVNPADWNDPAPTVYQTVANLATPAPANFIPDAVANLTADGGAGGITFKWTLPGIWHSNLQVELLESDTNTIVGAPVIWAGVNTGVYIQKGDTTTRYYWVRVRNIAGNTTSVTNPLLANAGLAVASTSGQGPKGDPGDVGPTGSGGLVGSLTLQAIVVPATTAGHVSSYAGASGKFRVFLGTQDVTDQCAFVLAPLGDPDGLTYTLGAGTNYSFGSSGQTQTTVGSQGPTGDGVSAQTQTSSGIGSVGATWDSSSPTWDSSTLTWDAGDGGGGGGGSSTVTGTGSSGQ